MGTDSSTYTLEELVFSAINHDLGKIGDEQNESYFLKALLLHEKQCFHLAKYLSF